MGIEFFAMVQGFIDLKVALGLTLLSSAVIINLKNSLMKTLVFVITALGMVHLNGESGRNQKL